MLTVCSFLISILLVVKSVTLVEAIYTSAGVYKLLLAGEERVALRANIDLHIALGGSCLYDISASAGDGCVNIVRMNTFLCHCKLTSF